MIQPGSIFAIPIGELTRWGAGEKLSAKKLNQPLEAIEAIARGIPQPRQVVPPRRGGGRGTSARLCKIVSTDEEADMIEVQFQKRDTDEESETFGKLIDDGEPVTVDAWDEWKAKSWTPFIGRPDVFVGFLIEGKWMVQWQMRIQSLEPPTAVAGDCR